MIHPPGLVRLGGVTRGMGPVQRQVPAWLLEAVANDGKSRWLAIIDLIKLRVGRDDPPSRDDLDASRKAIARLEAQGLVQVETQPRLIKRTMIPAAGTGQPKQVQERREITVVELVPCIEQQS